MEVWGGIAASALEGWEVEVRERDFKTEISGNAMVYGVTAGWVAEERGEKIVGMQDIKEWRGQAAG